tara:strand:+ start:1768 stop:2475 length:708 start_codon:yes stop_codon:yes gene_type:complete
MAYQSIGIGTTADDGTGDSLRIGADKVNDNFSEIYTLLGTGSALTSGLSATASVVTLGSPVLTTPTISGAVSGTQTSATITTLTNTTLNGTTVNAGTATLAAGSLTDSSGAIDFGNENLTTTGTLASGAITTSANLTINSSAIVFEGATADAYETTVTVTDPTADRTITIPNVTGSVVTTGDSNTVTGTMIAADTVAEANMANDAIGSAELKSVATLLIKNSSGSTLKTIYGAGA